MERIEKVLEGAGLAMEAAGVAVIVLGALVATGVALVQWPKVGADKVYAVYRIGLARSILLGLELLVAGDIIRTVVVAPTWDNLGGLAVIVLIRMLLSLMLELEVTGRFPWQRTPEDRRRDVRHV
jgi:uncharacterized membrane protein